MSAALRAWLKKLHGVRQMVAPVDEIEAEAEKLGWRVVVLDGTDVEDKHAFLEACNEAFELPEWFGWNWDGLEECIADFDLAGADGIVLVWNGWGELAEADTTDFATGLDILRGAVRAWGRDGVNGGLLLLGEGPDIDVDEL